MTNTTYTHYAQSHRRHRRRVPAFLRDAVFARDGYACRYCGDPATEIDHILPWSASGRHDEDNLVAACTRCNHLAFNRVFPGFDEKQSYIRARLAIPAIAEQHRHQSHGCRCCDCGRAFAPLVDGASALLCRHCYANA